MKTKLKVALAGSSLLFGLAAGTLYYLDSQVTHLDACTRDGYKAELHIRSTGTVGNKDPKPFVAAAFKKTVESMNKHEMEISYGTQTLMQNIEKEITGLNRSDDFQIYRHGDVEFGEPGSCKP